jgi:hypothetical protein
MTAFFNKFIDRRWSSYNFYKADVGISTEYCYTFNVKLLAEQGQKFSYCCLPDLPITIAINTLILKYFYVLINKFQNQAIFDFFQTYESKNSLFCQVALNKPYMIQIRELIVFFSILLTSDHLEKAYDSYFQIDKRCAIRDYWQWLNYEAPANNDDYFKMISCNIVNKYLVIIPKVVFSFEEFELSDYGFDPNDGIWKSLPYNKLLSQKGNIPLNYNKETCNIIKATDTENDVIYKDIKNTYVDFSKCLKTELNFFYHDEENAVYFAMLPPQLTRYIKDFFSNLSYFLDDDPEIKSKSFINDIPLLNDAVLEILKNEKTTLVLKELVSAYVIDKTTKLHPYKTLSSLK